MPAIEPVQVPPAVPLQPVPTQPVQRTGKIDLSQAITWRLVDCLTYQEIADRFGVSSQSVQEAMKRYMPFLVDPKGLKVYQQRKVDIWNQVEHELIVQVLQGVQSGTFKPTDLVSALKVVSTHVRLLAGESTSNVGLVVKALEQAHKDVHATPVSE